LMTRCRCHFPCSSHSQNAISQTSFFPMLGNHARKSNANLWSKSINKKEWSFSMNSFVQRGFESFAKELRNTVHFHKTKTVQHLQQFFPLPRLCHSSLCPECTRLTALMIWTKNVQ
jgi:hypothetical protein